MNISTERDRFALERALLATDFSPAADHAYTEAIRICLLSRASLSILHVFSTPEAFLTDLSEHASAAHHMMQQHLDALVDHARKSGLECCGIMANGSTHETIVAVAASRRIDIIFLGTRSIHGFDRLLFGSTAEAVLRQAECAVLTVGPQAALQQNTYLPIDGTVVFATDFHSSTSEALRAAACLAQLFGLPLHCVHVLPRSFETGSQNGVVSTLIAQALKQQALQELSSPTSPFCSVVYGSEISNAIIEYSRGHRAMLIVLGVRRSSLIASHVPAHIAYRIITEAACPVLTIAFPRLERANRIVVAGDLELEHL